MLAAAWFTLCGHDVAWPLEPCAYDLLVWSEGRAQRVQVKSTTRRTESGWFASISRHGSSGGPYDPEDIDLFFVVDGDLNYYLIPVSVVGGLRAIALRSYERFLVANGSVPGMNSD